MACSKASFRSTGAIKKANVCVHYKRNAKYVVS